MLEIQKYPKPVLRKRCEELKEITEETLKLAEEMKKKMITTEGIGLAGNQIGVEKRIIVVQTEKGPEVFFNPRILKISKENEFSDEGCLSLPNMYLKIRRAKEVLVEAQDIDKKIVQIEARDLPARIFQHEIDHINGKLIINRIGFWERLKIRKLLHGIATKTRS